MNPAPSSFKLDGRQRLIALAIALFAFVLRLIYVTESQASPYFEAPIMDPLYHLEWARALAEGETFQEGPFFRAPLYPWFLGTLLRFFGENLFLARLVQAGLGGLTAFLTILLARRAFSFRAAAVAGVLVAINWVLIYFDGELLIPTLAIPLNLLSLWLSLRWRDEPTARNAGAAGLAWGVAALARPNVLLFMPLLFAWMLWRSRPEWKRAWVHGLALTAGVLAAISPVTTYNLVVGGDSVLISSQAGVNFWIGNNPQSDGSTAIVPGTRPGWWDGFYDSIALAEQAEGRELAPSEVSSHYSSKAWGFITGEPAQALRHLLWKLRLFWMDWELGNNADVPFFAFHFSSLLRWLPPSFGLLGPLALIGLCLCRRRWSELFPLWGFSLTYMLSVVLFFVCSRYRAPMLPLFAIFGGALLVALFDWLLQKEWKAIAIAGVALVLVAVPMQLLPERLDTTEAKGLWALGIHELEVDHPKQAKAYFEQSLQANPSYWIAYKDLGLAHQAAGDLIDAQQSFEQALEIKPGDLQISSLLVDLALAREDLQTARRTALRSLEANPAFAPAYDSLARVHVAERDLAAARAVLTRGLERAPQDFFLNFRLGALALQESDPCEAAEYLGRAMASPGPPSEALLQSATQAWRQAKADCGS